MPACLTCGRPLTKPEPYCSRACANLRDNLKFLRTINRKRRIIRYFRPTGEPLYTFVSPESRNHGKNRAKLVKPKIVR